MTETAGLINVVVIREREPWGWGQIDLQGCLCMEFHQGRSNSEVNWNCHRKPFREGFCHVLAAQLSAWPSASTPSPFWRRPLDKWQKSRSWCGFPTMAAKEARSSSLYTPVQLADRPKASTWLPDTCTPLHSEWRVVWWTGGSGDRSGKLEREHLKVRTIQAAVGCDTDTVSAWHDPHCVCPDGFSCFLFIF